MPTSVKQMMEAANALVPKITPAEAREMMAKGNTLVVDVRDAPELEKKLLRKRAAVCPRLAPVSENRECRPVPGQRPSGRPRTQCQQRTPFHT